MKKIKILMPVLIAAGCITVLCAKELKASAETAFHSRGNFVTDDGKMAFYKTDLDYLGNEITLLENEIDQSILEQIYTDPIKEPRQGTMQSKGIIDYDNGKMVLDSRDMAALAAGLDRLENNYASSAGSALNRIGTYIDASGNISHMESSDETISIPTLKQIKEGICQSQSIDHLADVTPIIADNLTAGTAAWVNGSCIIGNGADNERAYKKGKEDGEDGDDEDMDIKYTYHTHVNGLGEEVTEPIVYTLTAPGGCYKADGHEHGKTGNCPSHEESRRITHNHEVKGSYGDNFTCPHCGHHTTFSEGESDVYKMHECSYNVRDVVYDCGTPTNKWRILCGKQNGQLEGVVITIRPKQ